MLTYYCPNCWQTVNERDERCPACGFILERYDEMAFEDKLLTALHHSVPERRIMAAQILGNLKNRRALPEFEKIVRSGEGDFFFLRAILQATAKIDHPDRNKILFEASHHSSTLVSQLASQLIAQLSKIHDFEEWDKNTG
jgi:hypothetical protein